MTDSSIPQDIIAEIYKYSSSLSITMMMLTCKNAYIVATKIHNKHRVGERVIPKKKLMSVAAKEGYLNIVEYGLEIRCDYNSKAHFAAIKKGRVDIVDWALRNRYPTDGDWDYNLLEKAAKHGHCELIDYYTTQKGKRLAFQECTIVSLTAAKNDKLEILKWLCKHGYKLDYRRIIWDAVGNEDILCWAKTRVNTEQLIYKTPLETKNEKYRVAGVRYRVL